MSGRLEGKVCVITGTGGSMGRAAALLFTRQGAMVVGCDISEANGLAALKEVNAAGGTMVSLQPCDLTKPEQCLAVVDLAIKTFGRIDVLYNNAAKAYFNWIEDVSDEEWRATINEEVDLVFYLTRAAWPHLKKSGGTIVNTASATAWTTFTNLGAIAHSTAKAGIVGFHLRVGARADVVGVALAGTQMNGLSGWRALACAKVSASESSTPTTRSSSSFSSRSSKDSM